MGPRRTGERDCRGQRTILRGGERAGENPRLHCMFMSNYIFQTTGTLRTFVNGGMIIREELQCSNGIIHVLERPLSPIKNMNVLEYIEESTREGGG